MNPFQIVAIAIFAALIVAELWKFSSRSTPWPALLRLMVWMAGAAVTYHPDLAGYAARLAGIGRGADFAVYCVSLGLLMCVFYLYTRQVSFERRLTDLVRHQAIQEARRGGGQLLTNAQSLSQP